MCKPVSCEYVAAWPDRGQMRNAVLKSVNPYRQGSVTPYEVRFYPLRFAHNLHVAEALHDLLPQYAQLHLRQAVAHAAVYAETEGYMVAGIGAVDDKVIGILDRGVIMVA